MYILSALAMGCQFTPDLLSLFRENCLADYRLYLVILCIYTQKINSLNENNSANTRLVYSPPNFLSMDESRTLDMYAKCILNDLILF